MKGEKEGGRKKRKGGSEGGRGNWRVRDGGMEGWRDGGMKGWRDGGMGEWMGGGTNGLMD